MVGRLLGEKGSRMAIMQPYFFPYVGYFQLIAAADRFVFYDDVSYIKQGWINRNRLRTGAQELVFTVPLRNASSNRSIAGTLVDGRQWPVWRDKFLRTLTQTYGRAPHFAQAMSVIEPVLAPEPKDIADLAIRSVRSVLERYGCTTPTERASEHYPNAAMAGEERLIAMCTQAGAATYLNMVGGTDLYSAANWERNGMELRFLRPKLTPYSERTPWMPGLSIIDLMMFVPLEVMRSEHWQGEIVRSGSRTSTPPTDQDKRA